jgi:hypothetical protein
VTTRTRTSAPPQRRGASPSSSNTMLPLTVRLADGREIETERSPERHREIHLGFLHATSRGLVEVAAGRRDQDGKLVIYTRRRRDHFVAAGVGGDRHWRQPALELAARHIDAGEELFLGVAARAQRGGSKQAVKFSQWLWVDVDGTEHLGRLHALLKRKPAHLLVESAGSGGMHAYWRLSDPLPARTIRTPDGTLIVNPLEVRQPTRARGRTRLVGYRELASKEVITLARRVDPIERANLRLIHALGYVNRDRKQTPVADRQCHEQSRVLRWAGTRNGKTGNYARIVRMDLWLPHYSASTLVGDLEDPPRSRPVQRRDLRRHTYDAYRLIPAAAYFARIARVELPERGNISCPSPVHEDLTASCSVDAYVFCCHGCGAQGTLYDLWSLMNGGPTGDALADDRAAFDRARKGAQDACKDLV